MRHSLRFVLTCATVLFLVSSVLSTEITAQSPREYSKADLQVLQWWWSVKDAVRPNGKKFPRNETKSWKMFVEGNAVKWYEQPSDQPEFDAEFSLDTRKDPHTILFKELTGSNSVDPDYRLKGVYDFDDEACTTMILVFSRDPHMEKPELEGISGTTLSQSLKGYLVLELEKVD